ncbi:MAG TPA: hypothetical protein VFO93_03030 [Hymenobacter sp.]|uniref:hypothetical protein n=1 Tax=Hymenobacter sp. TaxID=1898978 RepID=UPI002D7F0F89|nr:hypothetical protein [Hymenobacter sp.]HET9502488.1 hypothetical protein [Hymenobacter sp.]
MRKVFLSLAFALAVVSAWAFYPKAPQANGFMMVISRFSGTGFSSKGTIIVIPPDGQAQTQELETKTGTLNKISGSLDQLSIAELKTLNDLRATGWRLKTSTPVVLGNGAITETVYVLEKD